MNDQEFSEYLTKHYGINHKRLPDLFFIVRASRETLPAPGSLHRDKNKEFDRIIHTPVEAIHIETSAGVIKLDKSDPLFQYFNLGIKRVQDNFSKELNQADKSWQKKLNGMAEKAIFNFFDAYKYNGDVTQTKKDAVIGECLRHFGIYGRVPIKTKSEHNKDPKSADSYEDYLHNRVKSRRKKLK